MKVCPDCQSRFTQGETFCPNDGTRLVDARELSPGKLTGLSLDDMVALEELELSDGLGERYRGKLEESGAQVRVTAFNQAFEPDVARGEELEAALDAHSEPLPSEILALHSYRLEGDPPFTIEEYPTGPSLRTLLEERKSLDWQTSVRIAANVARAAGYLVDNGIFHSCIHPGSIFISDADKGSVQLGEWAHGVLSHRSSPLAYADEHPDGFFGYAGYMAPETIRDGNDVDLRSIVYVSGMLLYEMIVGKAPFTSKKSEDTLKRHLHEKPLKLAIAKSGADLHPELDDVLDMMWIKAPERRFQNPAAAIGALASLLDTSPDVLAPELSPREAPVFDEPVPGAIDDSAEEEKDAEETREPQDAEESEESDSAKKTMMGLPSIATKDEDDKEKEDDDAQESADDEAEEDAEESAEDTAKEEEAHQPPPKSGPSPSIIIEDPELRSAMDGDEEEDAAEDAAAEVEEGGDNGDGEKDVDKPARKTMLMGGQVGEDEEEDAAAAEDEEDEKDSAEESEESEEDDEGVDKPQKDTLMMGGDAGWDALDDEFDSEPSEEAGDDTEEKEDSDDADASTASDSQDETPDEDQTSDEDKGDEESETGAAVKDEEAADEEDEDADTRDDDSTDESGDTVGKMAAASIGSVEVEADESDDMSDDWFGKSTEETWETQQVEAVQEKSENVIRYATIGVLAALILGVIGFFIFVETGEEPVDKSEDAGEAAATAANETEGDDAESVDIGRLKSNFDSAISGDRILSPRANSAIKFLEELKRHGSETEEYAEARETFVTEARSRAESVEDKELYLARNLAGAAAQYSDDEDLQTYADELDTKWRESTEGGPDVGADSGSEEEAKEEPAAAKTTQRDEPTRRPSASNTESTPPKAPPKSTGGTEPPSGDSVSSLLSKADAAKASGNGAEAKRLYRKVLDKSSSNSKALSSLGALYFDDAAYSQAAKYYQRAVRASGGNMGYRLRLGMTYYKLGQFTRARDTWQAVLDRDPGNARAKQYIKLVESKIN